MNRHGRSVYAFCIFVVCMCWFVCLYVLVDCVFYFSIPDTITIIHWSGLCSALVMTYNRVVSIASQRLDCPTATLEPGSRPCAVLSVSTFPCGAATTPQRCPYGIREDVEAVITTTPIQSDVYAHHSSSR